MNRMKIVNVLLAIASFFALIVLCASILGLGSAIIALLSAIFGW